MNKYRLLLLATATLSLTLAGSLWALQGHDDNPDFPTIPFDHPAIQYADRAADDPIARLQKRLNSSDAKLEYHPRWGYLPGILKTLGIEVDSQILVFSKTSSQVSLISPASPRAIYFNDSVSVGYVQNGRALEFSALDPRLGAIFYTLDVDKTDRPTFTRQYMSCLQCHMSPATLNVPGIVISSVNPADEDSPYGRSGAFAADHRIPLEARWGGWFVTGQHGKIHHRGNVPVDYSPYQRQPAKSQNLTTLDEQLDTSAYLAPSSDIVALMTIEHQTRMTNLITRIGWETRVAVAERKLKEFAPRLQSNVDELVTYMLFADEEPLSEPVQGNSTFTKSFQQRGPRDHLGRSLRDFDLRQRLFRYPLSYMIYSPAFDNIPDIARNAIYRKLYDVVTSNDASESFHAISAGDRRAVLEILRDTKLNLPKYWKSPPPAK